MKIKAITTATDTNSTGLNMFKKSLDKFGWDLHIISDRYVAYGSKIVNAYKYAKDTELTHILILDAYDVVALGTPDEFLNKILDKDCILFNSEKGCWSRPELSVYYPQVDSDWKYLNGGIIFAQKDLFVKMYEENPIYDTDNDQDRFTDIYLGKRELYNMNLDTRCEVFQSIAFEDKDDFAVTRDGRLLNRKTNSLPVFLHGNGRTNMDWVYDFVK